MRAAFGPRSQADPPRRCVPLAAGSMSWQVVAWFTSILAGPTSELAGELLNLTGFANHRHRKSVFGGLVDLGLQGRRHLQQVGAFAGDLPPARIFRSLALLLVLLRGSGSLCGYTSLRIQRRRRRRRLRMAAQHPHASRTGQRSNGCQCAKPAWQAPSRAHEPCRHAAPDLFHRPHHTRRIRPDVPIGVPAAPAHSLV